MLVVLFKIILLNVIPLAEGFLLAVLLREQYRNRMTVAAVSINGDATKEMIETLGGVEHFEPMNPPTVESKLIPPEKTENKEESVQSEPTAQPDTETTTEDDQVAPPSDQELPQPSMEETEPFPENHPADSEMGGLINDILDDQVFEAELDDVGFPMHENESYSEEPDDSSMFDDDILARAMGNEPFRSESIDVTDFSADDSPGNVGGISSLAVELLGEDFDFEAALNKFDEIMNSRTIPPDVPPVSEENIVSETVESPVEPVQPEPEPEPPAARLVNLGNDIYRAESDFFADAVELHATTTFSFIRATFPDGAVETSFACPDPSQFSPGRIFVSDSPPMLPKKTKRQKTA